MTGKEYARILATLPQPLTFGAIKDVAAKADPDILPLELDEKPGIWIIKCQTRPSEWIQEWVEHQRVVGWMIFWKWPDDIVERLRGVCWDSSTGDTIYPEECAEAATEILRLRAEPPSARKPCLVADKLKTVVTLLRKP